MKNTLTLLPLLICFSLLAGYNFMSAQWTAPTAIAPGDNTAAPINVGSTTQAKSGNLAANILAATTEVRSNRYCDALGGNCIDTALLSKGANPVSVARAAGYPVTAVPSGISPEWPAAIVCEQGGTPVVLYAHGIGVSGDSFRYRDLSGTRRYDFNANGTYNSRAEVMGGCSVHASNGNLQGICAAGLCMGASAS